jgi:hypothetical protein
MECVLAWLVLAALSAVLVVVVVGLVMRPMRMLLTANSYLSPVALFYVRAFVIVMALAGLAGTLGNTAPCAEQAAGKNFMQWVWWVAEGLRPVSWAVSGFLLVYALLLTILYGVLGRYHDK